MSTTVTLRDYIDLPEWRVLSQPLMGGTNFSQNGTWLAEDYRNNDYSNSITYFITGQNILCGYHAKTDSWNNYSSSFTSGGTYGAGCSAVFVPSLGPRGSLLAGSTASVLNLNGLWSAPSQATWTRAGTVITVTTSAPHTLTGFAPPLYLQASSDTTATGVLSTFGGLGAASTGWSNLRTITVTSTTQFTFATTNTGGVSGTCTIGPYVSPNKLANRGDGKGIIVRVIGNGPGSSGKIEERHIISNTEGTEISVTLDEPLSFTPVAGDTFEFLSGSFLVLNTGASNTSNIFRRFDVATGLAATLNTTGMIGTIPSTANPLIALDEGYVPYDRKCYEGYLVGAATYDTGNTLTGGVKSCLQATATGATSLTGQAALGDAAVVINQFRNYQIRIVEDTVNTTAVGQRRRIISNTVGPSPVYTVAAWTVTPSANCKYVIENWTDNIIHFAGGTSPVYNYTHTSFSGVGTTNAWDTSTWATRLNANVTTGSFAIHAFGQSSTNFKKYKNNYIYLFRGSSQLFDLFDITGSATGSWVQNLITQDWGQYGLESFTIADSATLSYNPHNQEGRYFYFYPGATSSTTTSQRGAARFDLISLKVEKIAGARIVSDSRSISGKLACMNVFQDGNTKIAFWNCIRPMSISEFWQLIIYK